MSPAAPSAAQIAVLRYVLATRGRMADPGNLRIAQVCVANGWLTGDEGGQFRPTPAGAALAEG